jgi:hypothetical protein
MKSNNEEEAVRLFTMESSLYPESRHLMERLIKKVETNGKNESDQPPISSLTGETGAPETRGVENEN